MRTPSKAYIALSTRIAAVRARHRDLDAQVDREQKSPWPDVPLLKSLKRRRLRLKDEIKRCEGLLRTLARRPAIG